MYNLVSLIIRIGFINLGISVPIDELQFNDCQLTDLKIALDLDLHTQVDVMNFSQVWL